ncbi:MAG TPA: NAD(P)/FAD-dependent oxidoreductase [Gemmatimonadales bacterium]|nr:NAD(P)/FAD-dependent oxidoreductase [Gemmatimonadales bacterium]
MSSLKPAQPLAGSPRRRDVIIIGAGHNGLVCAAYLAAAGLDVLVLERREVVGGACVTEELWPGFQVSTAAYVNSLLRPEIIRDLELARHGFVMLPRDPSSFTPFPDGRYLLMGPDRDLTTREIAKFSQSDALALPRYEAMLERVARVIEPLLLETPPNPFAPGLHDLAKLASLAWRFSRLGRHGPEAIEILTGAARPILDRWFESEELKATLATDAIIGAMASPSTPGTAYVLFHHVMGECNGVRGVWGYVRGGMGGLAEALARAARERGTEIRVTHSVARIQVRQGRATGVVLEDGTELAARIVISNADPQVTFLGLTEAAALPEEFLDRVRHIDYSSASLKINVALSELPDFVALPGTRAGPHHRGTIHIAPTLEYMEHAFDDAKYGRTSARPILECTIPSVVDPSVAPPGRHLMSCFVQYAPYTLRDGSWDEHREAFADRCLGLLAEYAPNVRRAVIERQVLSPPDLERRYGLTGGNIFQGAMTLNQMFFLRPAPGYADYRTPLRGLYLCGAATHPGGGVMGACGYNAAREVLSDVRKRRV